MLLTLTGSSCAGKSTLLRALAGRLPGVALHDFDEIGVPAGPTSAWRQQASEDWVRRALSCQRHGVDLLLAGQSPLGEVLATPSAPELDGIAACLVDVADDERRRRIALRGNESYSARHVEDLVSWGEWQRGHARDPRHRPEVLTARCWPAMAWHRWADWSAGDPRWHTDVLDTTGKPVAVSAAELVDWVERRRAAYPQRAGGLSVRDGRLVQPDSQER
ncbi:MAG TPA: hypothetical protein VG756_08325 [Pseudonocardiaceae bacterium]|nr:hypothetical protein [Pseudonocardiaceae bacterium]